MRVPLPKYDDVPLPVLVEKADEFVTWYLDVKPWLCRCGLNNFGRNKKCAGCKTDRPNYFREEPK